MSLRVRWLVWQPSRCCWCSSLVPEVGGHAAPDVTSGYLAGAVTYDAIGLGNMGILLVQIRRGRFRGF